MKPKQFLPLCATLCLLTPAFIFPARAAIIAWTNTSGGSWSTAANWKPNSIPGAADDVLITSEGSYAVTMDVSPTISSLTLGGVSGQQTLTNTSQTLSLAHASVVNANGVMGMNASVLSGLGSLNIYGQVHWNGGSSGAGFAVTVQSGGVLNIQTTTTFSGVFTNLGTVNWLGGNVNVYTNGPTLTGAIWNQAGAIFDIQCDQVVANASLLGTFHNAGLVRKRITAGATYFNTFLDNSGTVQAQTGTINVQGPYTESPSATLAISLSALTPGSGFGKFQFSAAPTFAGTFALSTLNGYRPNLGDSFVVIGYPAFAGGFTSYNGLDLGGGLLLTPQLAASSLTLVAVAGVSLPKIASISLSGANVVLNCINGQLGETNITLTSTNMAKPLIQWTPAATNVLSANGNFTITLTNIVNPPVPQRFFILRLQ